jgi:hypothetical protein
MTHEEQEFATLLLNVSVVLFVLLIEFVILRRQFGSLLFFVSQKWASMYFMT